MDKEQHKQKWWENFKDKSFNIITSLTDTQRKKEKENDFDSLNIEPFLDDCFFNETKKRKRTIYSKVTSFVSNLFSKKNKGSPYKTEFEDEENLSKKPKIRFKSFFDSQDFDDENVSKKSDIEEARGIIEEGDKNLAEFAFLEDDESTKEKESSGVDEKMEKNNVNNLKKKMLIDRKELKAKKNSIERISEAKEFEKVDKPENRKDDICLASKQSQKYEDNMSTETDRNLINAAKNLFGSVPNLTTTFSRNDLSRSILTNDSSFVLTEADNLNLVEQNSEFDGNDIFYKLMSEDKGISLSTRKIIESLMDENQLLKHEIGLLKSTIFQKKLREDDMEAFGIEGKSSSSEQRDKITFISRNKKGQVDMEKKSKRTQTQSLKEQENEKTREEKRKKKEIQRLLQSIEDSTSTESEENENKESYSESFTSEKEGELESASSSEKSHLTQRGKRGVSKKDSATKQSQIKKKQLFKKNRIAQKSKKRTKDDSNQKRICKKKALEKKREIGVEENEKRRKTMREEEEMRRLSQESIALFGNSAKSTIEGVGETIKTRESEKENKEGEKREVPNKFIFEADGKIKEAVKQERKRKKHIIPNFDQRPAVQENKNLFNTSKANNEKEKTSAIISSQPLFGNQSIFTEPSPVFGSSETTQQSLFGPSTGETFSFFGNGGENKEFNVDSSAMIIDNSSNEEIKDSTSASGALSFGSQRSNLTNLVGFDQKEAKFGQNLSKFEQNTPNSSIFNQNLQSIPDFNQNQTMFDQKPGISPIFNSFGQFSNFGKSESNFSQNSSSFPGQQNDKNQSVHGQGLQFDLGNKKSNVSKESLFTQAVPQTMQNPFEKPSSQLQTNNAFSAPQNSLFGASSSSSIFSGPSFSTPFSSFPSTSIAFGSSSSPISSTSTSASTGFNFGGDKNKSSSWPLSFNTPFGSNTALPEKKDNYFLSSLSHNQHPKSILTMTKEHDGTGLFTPDMFKPHELPNNVNVHTSTIMHSFPTGTPSMGANSSKTMSIANRPPFNPTLKDVDEAALMASLTNDQSTEKERRYRRFVRGRRRLTRNCA